VEDLNKILSDPTFLCHRRIADLKIVNPETEKSMALVDFANESKLHLVADESSHEKTIDVDSFLGSCTLFEIKREKSRPVRRVGDT
jgi:hypothetical protein